jgi:hypothetical protein
VAFLLLLWPLARAKGAMDFIASLNEIHHKSKFAKNQGLP